MIDIVAVKERVTLVDAFEFLGLDYPTGKSHPKIICPFEGHAEKTPSCVLYPENDTVWCYGCNRGGDVIELAQLVRGWDFIQAITELADYAHVQDSYMVGRELEARLDPSKLFKLVADQAHADVVAWVKTMDLDVEHTEAVFSFYDEVMRAERAQEITREAAVKELLAWRRKWKARLDV